MTGSASPEAFTFALITALLAFYFAYLQLRRFRFQKIAEQLHAEYKPEGLFKTGDIAGSSHGRAFRVTTRSMAVARGKATFTILSVDCLNNGIPLSLYGRFFKHFPDWRFAFTRGDAKSRASGADVVLQNARIRLDSQFHPRVQSLFRDMPVIFPNLLKKRSTCIELKQEALSYTMLGVLKNVATVRQILLLLTKLADRIESEPVNAEPTSSV